MMNVAVIINDKRQIIYITWIICFEPEGNSTEFRHNYCVFSHGAVDIPTEQLTFVV